MLLAFVLAAAGTVTAWIHLDGRSEDGFGRWLVVECFDFGRFDRDAPWIVDAVTAYRTYDDGRGDARSSS